MGHCHCGAVQTGRGAGRPSGAGGGATSSSQCHYQAGTSEGGACTRYTGSLEHSHRDSHRQSPSHGSHAEAHERLNAARPRSRSTCQRVKCRGYPAHRALVVATGVASIAHPQGVCTQHEASRVLEYAGYALHTILQGQAERAARGRASAGTQSAFHRPTGGGLPIKS